MTENKNDIRYMEFGSADRDVIILLHGGGLSWWNYKDAARLLESDYRVIIPILDGHGGSECEFTTIQANADRIIGFIDKHFGGSVLLIGGLSLGAQILLKILSKRGDICRYAIVESALVIPSPTTAALIGPAFGSCYGLIRQRWFARLQFRALRIKSELFGDYYSDTCRISKSSLIGMLRENSLYTIALTLSDCTAKAYIFVGEKEGRNMKRSAEMICKKMNGSVLCVLQGMYHGEFSINHADKYAAAIRSAVMNNSCGL